MTPDSQNGEYVLEILSGKYEGGEFSLSHNSEVSVGRSNERDMVLVEDMVSRHHAKFSVTDEGVFVEDLGSTNGTFVNGEKITKQTRLKVGERVLIGTNIMKLVRRDAGGVSADAATPHPRNNPQAVDQDQSGNLGGNNSSRQTMGGSTLAGSISGLVEEVPLEDLFQLFESARKTGMVIVQTDTEVGRIYLEEGDIYYAEIDSSPELGPEKAFYRIFAWGRGQFSLEKSEQKEVDETLNKSVSQLLEEGIQQRDRLKSLGDDVPDYGDTVRVAEPLVPPLRSLDDKQLDTFQLVFNYDTVSKVLNQSRESDFEAMEKIVELVRQDYIETE